MDDATAPVVDVLVSAELPDTDVDELVGQLRRLGMAPAARVRVMPVTRADGVTWSLLLVVVLSAFLAAISTRLGNDAYQAVSGIIRRAVDRRRDHRDDPDPAGDPAPDPQILLRDRDTGVEIVLAPDLPPEAVEELARLRSATRGPVQWDRRQRRWLPVERAGDGSPFTLPPPGD